MNRCIPVLLVWALCGQAGAQALYKCTAGGKVTYSGTPCTEGVAKVLAVPPAPEADPGRAEELQRQKALVDKLGKERMAREERERIAPPPTSAALSRQLRCDKLRLELKWTEEELRKTAGPATEAIRKKAQRQNDVLAIECPA